MKRNSQQNLCTTYSYEPFNSVPPMTSAFKGIVHKETRLKGLRGWFIPLDFKNVSGRLALQLNIELCNLSFKYKTSDSYEPSKAVS